MDLRQRHHDADQGLDRQAPCEQPANRHSQGRGKYGVLAGATLRRGREIYRNRPYGKGHEEQDSK